MTLTSTNILESVALVAAIFFSTIILPVQLYATNFALDTHCNVVFDFNSSSTKQVDIDAIHDSCMKKTFENDLDQSKANMDCFYKCYYQKLGYLLKNGTYDSRTVVELYENFSNASSGYISNVDNLYQSCVQVANERIEEFVKNGTTLTECAFYGEFEHCLSLELFVAIVDVEIPAENGTTINICGDETSSGGNYSASYLTKII